MAHWPQKVRQTRATRRQGATPGAAQQLALLRLENRRTPLLTLVLEARTMPRFKCSTFPERKSGCSKNEANGYVNREQRGWAPRAMSAVIVADVLPRRCSPEPWSRKEQSWRIQTALGLVAAGGTVLMPLTVPPGLLSPPWGPPPLPAGPTVLSPPWGPPPPPPPATLLLAKCLSLASNASCWLTS